jgi:hypothetical protein
VVPDKESPICMNAEQKFVGVWAHLTNDWGRLTTFRQMGILGEDAAREAMHRSHEDFVENQLINGAHQDLLLDRESFIQEGHAERLPHELTETAVKNFRQTLHASTIIFAHSILDAVMFDCVCICGISSPIDWSDAVSNKKITLAEVAKKPYLELLVELVEVDLRRYERESLITKVDRIFQICKPTKQEYLTNGFRFDRERLVRLDELRHNLVHRPGVEWSFDTIYEDLEFMQRCGLHIFSMIGKRFGLRFSAEQLVQFIADQKKDLGVKPD